jgi:hypothetical protein
MVVFSIYAMTEYSIVIQLPASPPSSTVAVSNSTSSSISISSPSVSTEVSQVSQTTSCGGCSSLPSGTDGYQLSGMGAKNASPGSDVASVTTNAVQVCPVTPSGSLVLTTFSSLDGRPISGLGVQATDRYSSCSGEYTIVDLGDSVTNSSGMISICCNSGSYNVRVDYQSVQYNAIANVSAGGSTCVSLFVPSGKVSVSYSATIRGLCH